MKSLWPSELPLAAYRSLIFFRRFLFDVLVARADGIDVIKESRIWSKKSNIVWSTSAYSSNCWMFWTGFARYLFTIAFAPDVPPVICSSFSNFCCELMYRTELRESSTKIVAVAFDVCPVTISPFTNLLIDALSVPSPDSVMTLSPSSNKTYAVVLVSCRM